MPKNLNKQIQSFINIINLSRCSFYRPHYVIKDDSGNSVLKIVGPGCICDGPYPCCCENKFMVRNYEFLHSNELKRILL